MSHESRHLAKKLGRLGNSVSITLNPLPPLAFVRTEGGFSYTATRTSATPLIRSNEGF